VGGLVASADFRTLAERVGRARQLDDELRLLVVNLCCGNGKSGMHNA
jgi:hypothetical protein